MKGKLKHKKGKWFVEYFVKHEFLDVHLDKTEIKELPLHPDKIYVESGSIIGIELNNTEVEFEIVQYIKPKFGGREDKTLKDYAKLIQPKHIKIDSPIPSKLKEYVENKIPNAKSKVEQAVLEKEETWDDIINTYALTTGLIPGFTKPNFINRKMLIEWLKEHYFSPKKK